MVRNQHGYRSPQASRSEVARGRARPPADHHAAPRGQEEAVRLILYAGEPHGVPIVSHGPFVGDSKADIRRLYSTVPHDALSTVCTEFISIWHHRGTCPS